MSLRLRRGGGVIVPPPPGSAFGPTLGDDYVRQHAGTATNPTQPSGIPIGPGGLTQAAINAAGNGATLSMTGITRTTGAQLNLLPGQTLIGPTDHSAILSGAIVVTPVSDSGIWSITGQGIATIGDDPWANGNREIDGIIPPSNINLKKDGVYYDGFPLWQVPSTALLSQPTPYNWPAFYWDYGANKIWLNTNPTGKVVEVCKNGNTAISANNATLKNIVVTKFGNRATTPMVEIGSNGTAENCWFLGSAGTVVGQQGGLATDGSTLRGCKIYYGGEAGIGGGHFPAFGAGPVLVDGNEVAYCNISGFNWPFEGGGSKWNRTGGLIVRNNWVHDNYGMGFWTDGFNYDVLVEDNVFEDNYGSGFEAELGYNHIIRRNSFYRNGYHHPLPDAWTGGPHPADCMNVQIYQNNVVDNASGICSPETNRDSTAGVPPAAAGSITECQNLDVHDNFIQHPNSHPSDTQGYGMGIAAGILISSTTVSPSSLFYTSFNNRWYNNTYRLGNLNGGTHFRWQAGRITWAQWRAAGQDGGSTAEQI